MSNLFNTLSAIATAYESKSVWELMSKASDEIFTLSEDNVLSKDSYSGYQLRVGVLNNEGKKVYFYAEVHKDSNAAAANNYPKWQLFQFKAGRAYQGFALTNKEILEASEYEAKKAELTANGIVIDTSRKDQGIINIPMYDPSKDAASQRASIKLVAMAAL